MFAHVSQVDEIDDIAVVEAGVFPRSAIALEMFVGASIGTGKGVSRQGIVINVGSESEPTGDRHPALPAFTHFNNYGRFDAGVLGDEKDYRQFVFIMNTVPYDNDLSGLDAVVFSYGQMKAPQSLVSGVGTEVEILRLAPGRPADRHQRNQQNRNCRTKTHKAFSNM